MGLTSMKSTTVNLTGVTLVLYFCVSNHYFGLEDVRDCCLALISLLLDRGAKINATDHEGRTALAGAVIARSKPAYPRALLDRGANPLVGVEIGSNALEWAIKSNNAKLVEMFLEAISTRQYRCGDFARLIPKQVDEMEPEERE